MLKTLEHAAKDPDVLQSGREWQGEIERAYVKTWKDIHWQKKKINKSINGHQPLYFTVHIPATWYMDLE